MLAEHKPPVYGTSGLTLITSSRPALRRPTASIRRSTTTTCCQSILAKIEANVAGADDALMLDTRGFVAETNATHVFLVERGVRADTDAPSPVPRASPAPAVLELCDAHGIPHEVDAISR